MDRQSVFQRVDEERKYQESKWTDADAVNTPGDFILYMHRELDKAVSAYVSPVHNIEPALHAIRKVVATGVAALERFGCPPRE